MSKEIQTIKKIIGTIQIVLTVCDTIIDVIQLFIDKYREIKTINNQIRILKVKQYTIGLIYCEKRRLDLLKQKILI
jgi:hypothetical protein